MTGRPKKPSRPKSDGPEVALRKRMRTRDRVMDYTEQLHALGFRRVLIEDMQLADDSFHCLLVIDEEEMQTDRLLTLMQFCGKVGAGLSLKGDHITRQSRLMLWVPHG